VLSSRAKASYLRSTLVV